MKLLVFAHTPPPHHGQSYMVKLMLDAFGGDRRNSPAGAPSPGPAGIECYHVNCRYSDSMEDIGSFRFEKFWLVLRYSFEAIWCRFRYGIRAMYYVPAPGKRAALYRDWVVMSLCRPFFPHIIHHWHAVGLGDWLQSEGTWVERWVTHWLLGRPSLGIALAIPGMRDSLWFRSRKVVDVPNGIPDPCPHYEEEILPRRKGRLAHRRQLLAGADASQPPPEAGADPDVCRVLFLAHCTREKGAFDTLDAVLILNRQLATQGARLRFHLTVAGAFLDPAEEAEFRSRLATAAESIHYAGFVRDGAKTDLLQNADLFCFPTFYPAEGQPVNLLEASAFGLPIVTTCWRAIPEMLPPGYAGFVPPRSAEAVAAALLRAASEDGSSLRSHFFSLYTIDHHLHELQAKLQTVAEN